MPGRKWTSDDAYRYGFNGKEQDKDIHSITVYDYGFRIYNPAIAKFLSVDPLAASYPWYTPYQFAGNKPIYAVDLDGLEEKSAILDYLRSTKKPVIVEVNKNQVQNSTPKLAPNITIGNLKKQAHAYVASKYGLNELERNHSEIYFKNRHDEAIATLYEFAKLTDVNDAVVLATTITRGEDNAINIDGTLAGQDGVDWATAGIFIPFVSGSLVKGGSNLIRGSIKVFKNGIEVLENAVKIGKYGFKGTKAFNEIVKAVQAGGNIVANSKEEALKFLKEAFPDIADETGKATSKYGYRIDEFVEEGTDGLKQGHQGWHINYYDKESKIKGTILLDEPPKAATTTTPTTP